MPLLSVDGLQVKFALRRGAVTAVDDFSLNVEAGECLGIVGESGCGKSTTGLSIMRLLPGNGRVSAGKIVFDGTDLATLSERQMRDVRGNGVALIPQDPLTSLNPSTKIGRQIGEGYMIHRGASQSDGMKRALEVLEMVEMPRPKERLRQYPFELSGGLRQRVMIAMGLVCSPKVLIADEPTTALDVTIQAQILDIIDHLRTSLGMAVILITHDMGVIAERTDRVIVMYAGEKAEDGKTTDLFASMRHPYSKALLSSVPSIDYGATTRLQSIPGLPPDLSRTIVGCRFAPRCPSVTDQCKVEAPQLVEDAQHHSYACFNPVGGRDTSRTAVAVAAPTTNGSSPPPQREVVLRTEHLVKSFPVKGGALRRTVGFISAVADVTMEVRAGETFGLVGESGCGKTTIGRLLVGLEEATSGSIFFEDKDLSRLGDAGRRDARRDRQMMFQDPYSSLNPRMTVAEILREPLAIQKVGTKAAQRTRVEELLLSVGLEPKAGQRHPHEFSGGQRQRIGLARALALNPKLIVADEPVSALDVSIQAQLLNVMKDLQKDLGITYLMISHDLAVVHYMADTIGVMYLGKIVEYGDAEEVFSKPAHPYTRALLDAVPIPDPVEAKAKERVRLEGELPSAASPPSGCRFRTRCPRAQQRCADEEPTFSTFGERQFAACHFPLRTPVSVGASSAASGGEPATV
jgi:peptide/nickel transport system ATP-binding protein